MLYITLTNLFIREINEKPGGVAWYTDDPAMPYKWQHSARSYAAIVEWAKSQDWKVIVFDNGNMVTKG